MQCGKKLILAALLCLLAISACGGTPNNAQVLVEPEGQGGVGDIKTFDPALATDFASNQAIRMVFTGLVQLDDNLTVQPQLAQSYHVAPDGITWTFNLRPNLKFSDGTPLTSTDVAYSIDRALQPTTKSNAAPSYLALIKDAGKLLKGNIKTIIGDSLLTPDPNTIIIVTSRKAQYFLDTLTYPSSYVIEKKIIDLYGNTFASHLSDGLGGAGPFIVKSYQPGKHIVFVPNSNYYGPKPRLKEVILPFYTAADTTYRAYQASELDQTAVPPAQLEAARQLTKEFRQVPQLRISYYAMNYLTKPFDNIKIRQAFELAINKDLIVQTVWKGTVIPTNHIIPSGMPGYNPHLTGPSGVKGTAGDVTLANRLFQEGLQEEGWSSVAQVPPIILTIASGGQATIRDEATVLQQMWQTTLGIHVTIDDIDFNKFLGDRQAAQNNPNGIQFWGIGWNADYPDPQDWTTLQFDKGALNNAMNYGQNQSSNAAAQQTVQQELEAADVNLDSAARLQQYQDAEQMLVNDVAWFPMEQVTQPLLYKQCVQGVVDNPSSLIPSDDWAKIYISADPDCANVSIE